MNKLKEILLQHSMGDITPSEWEEMQREFNEESIELEFDDQVPASPVYDGKYVELNDEEYNDMVMVMDALIDTFNIPNYATVEDFYDYYMNCMEIHGTIVDPDSIMAYCIIALAMELEEEAAGTDVTENVSSHQNVIAHAGLLAMGGKLGLTGVHAVLKSRERGNRGFRDIMRGARNELGLSAAVMAKVTDNKARVFTNAAVEAGDRIKDGVAPVTDHIMDIADFRRKLRDIPDRAERIALRQARREARAIARGRKEPSTDSDRSVMEQINNAWLYETRLERRAQERERRRAQRDRRREMNRAQRDEAHLANIATAYTRINGPAGTEDLSVVDVARAEAIARDMQRNGVNENNIARANALAESSGVMGVLEYNLRQSGIGNVTVLMPQPRNVNQQCEEDLIALYGRAPVTMSPRRFYTVALANDLVDVREGSQLDRVIQNENFPGGEIIEDDLDRSNEAQVARVLRLQELNNEYYHSSLTGGENNMEKGNSVIKHENAGYSAEVSATMESMESLYGLPVITEVDPESAYNQVVVYYLQKNVEAGHDIEDGTTEADAVLGLAHELTQGSRRISHTGIATSDQNALKHEWYRDALGRFASPGIGGGAVTGPSIRVGRQIRASKDLLFSNKEVRDTMFDMLEGVGAELRNSRQITNRTYRRFRNVAQSNYSDPTTRMEFNSLIEGYATRMINAAAEISTRPGRYNGAFDNAAIEINREMERRGEQNMIQRIGQRVRDASNTPLYEPTDEIRQSDSSSGDMSGEAGYMAEFAADLVDMYGKPRAGIDVHLYYTNCLERDGITGERTFKSDLKYICDVFADEWEKELVKHSIRQRARNLERRTRGVRDAVRRVASRAADRVSRGAEMALLDGANMVRSNERAARMAARADRIAERRAMRREARRFRDQNRRDRWDRWDGVRHSDDDTEITGSHQNADIIQHEWYRDMLGRFASPGVGGGAVTGPSIDGGAVPSRPPRSQPVANTGDIGTRRHELEGRVTDVGSMSNRELTAAINRIAAENNLQRQLAEYRRNNPNSAERQAAAEAAALERKKANRKRAMEIVTKAATTKVIDPRNPKDKAKPLGQILMREAIGLMGGDITAANAKAEAATEKVTNAERARQTLSEAEKAGRKEKARQEQNQIKQERERAKRAEQRATEAENQAREAFQRGAEQGRDNANALWQEAARRYAEQQARERNQAQNASVPRLGDGVIEVDDYVVR